MSEYRIVKQTTRGGSVSFEVEHRVREDMAWGPAIFGVGTLSFSSKRKALRWIEDTLAQEVVKTEVVWP